jgi:hypothetical protein
MEQLIQSIATKLNLPESSVRSGVQVLLKFLSEKSHGTQLGEIISKIPGAQTLLNTPVEKAEGSPGLLGGLFGTAGSFLGGQSGDIAKVAASLQQSGIDFSKAIPFVQTFIAEAKQRVGPEVVDQILAQIPALKNLQPPK